MYGKRKYDMDWIKYMFTLQQKHSAVNIWIAWKKNNSSSWLCVYIIFLNLNYLFRTNYVAPSMLKSTRQPEVSYFGTNK